MWPKVKGLRMNMEECSEPWEVTLLKGFCKSDVSLEGLSYARKSVLAGSWYVASHSKLHQSEVCLCGENVVEECQIRQWVGFYTSRIKLETDWDTLSRDALAAVLEELNRHLSRRVYLVSNRLSLADIILYFGLHRYLVGLPFNQRSSYIHICRWFDHVQHFPGVRPFSLPLVVFHLTPDLLKQTHM